MSAIIGNVFNLYQQMSSPVFCVEWSYIVENVCFAKGWFNEKGLKSTVERRQTWEMLNKHKRAQLLTVCNKDAAELWYTYCTFIIKHPQRFAVKSFWN